MAPRNSPSRHVEVLVRAFCNAIRRVQPGGIAGFFPRRRHHVAGYARRGLRVRNSGLRDPRLGVAPRRPRGHLPGGLRRSARMRVGGRRPRPIGLSNNVPAAAPAPPRADSPPPPVMGFCPTHGWTNFIPPLHAEADPTAAGPSAPPPLAPATPPYRRLPTPTPASPSSLSRTWTPDRVHIPGLNSVATRPPTPAPPGFGGGFLASPGFGNGGGIFNPSIEGPPATTVAARRGAAPAYTNRFTNAGSAAPAPHASAPARWNATAAANRRPGVTPPWRRAPNEEEARSIWNGPANHGSSSSEEYSPA
ncbi:unnamed protein product [Urochloa decumbens]|uniref:Uncharacterized protein n=1 Tax=Urochloa decumbens TaxID=240449 RepID=A0ABC8WIS2_9POAL